MFPQRFLMDGLMIRMTIERPWTQKVDDARARTLKKFGVDPTQVRMYPTDFVQFVRDVNKAFFGMDISTSETTVNYRGLIVMPEVMVLPNNLYMVFQIYNMPQSRIVEMTVSWVAATEIAFGLVLRKQLDPSTCHPSR